MPTPSEGESIYNGFSLSNGTYIVLELQGVARGSLAQLSLAERATMTDTYIERDGRDTFAAFVANSRRNADITNNLEEL